MIALRFRSAARARIARVSSICWGVERFGEVGQSMLETVATHAARNSRGGGGGRGRAVSAPCSSRCFHQHSQRLGQPSWERVSAARRRGRGDLMARVKVTERGSIVYGGRVVSCQWLV